MPQISVSNAETVEGAKGDYLKLSTVDGKYYNVFGDLMDNVKGPGVYDVAFTKKGKYTNISEIAKSKNQTLASSNGASASRTNVETANANMYISSCVNAAAEITKSVIDKGVEKDTNKIIAVAGTTLMQLLINVKAFLHGGPISQAQAAPKRAKAEEVEEAEQEELVEEVPF